MAGAARAGASQSAGSDGSGDSEGNDTRPAGLQQQTGRKSTIPVHDGAVKPPTEYITLDDDDDDDVVVVRAGKLLFLDIHYI